MVMWLRQCLATPNILLKCQRSIASSCPALAIDKKLLTELRKKTGYSFTKCNEAMKRHDNDATKAEQWLHEQAEKEGWLKAKKLEGRTTAEGLVGVLASQNHVALVEVACETDFVARNDLFVNLVASTASSVLEFRRQVVQQNLRVASNTTGGEGVSDGADMMDHHLRDTVMEHELKHLMHPTIEGITLEEHVVQLVGKMGENLRFKRALTISTPHDNVIGVSTHGNNSVVPGNGCHVGKFAGVVVLKPTTGEKNSEELSKLARDLSQHVIGMNPVALHSGNGVSSDESLMGQEFLLDDKITVGDLLVKKNVEVVDYIRFGLSS